jgi:hypothetical protein
MSRQLTRALSINDNTYKKNGKWMFVVYQPLSIVASSSSLCILAILTSIPLAREFVTVNMWRHLWRSTLPLSILTCNVPRYFTYLVSWRESVDVSCYCLCTVMTSARPCNKVGHLFWFTILAQHETDDVILYIHSVHK